MRVLSLVLLGAVLPLVACGSASQRRDGGVRDEAGVEDADLPPDAPIRVQVFTRTEGFRHDSIGAGLALFEALEQRGAIALRATEDAAQLVRALDDVEIVVFLSTSGEILEPLQRDAIEAFVRGGGGFVGVHSAADTEYEWPFYAELLGARFEDHPAVQSARVEVAVNDHPSTSFLPQVWEREDEWYNFDRDPRESGVQVLLTLDESSYEGGRHGADHPIAWCRTLDRGRSFYTALGHTEESWSEPLFAQHIEGALRWAAGR